MVFKFKIWNSIKQTWPVYKANFGVLLLLTAITAVVNAFSQENGVVGTTLSYLVSFLLIFVWIKYTLSLIDKKEYDFFSNKSIPTFLQYWNITKTIILFSVIILLSIPFLLVPAFYFSGRLAFALYLSVENNQGAIKSISDSWALTKNNGWRLFWKNFVVGLFMASGFILFGVGALVTFPIGYIVMAKIFREYQLQSGIKKEETVKEDKEEDKKEEKIEVESTPDKKE